MSTNRVVLSPGYYPDNSIGRPISNAKIYVGIPDLDPAILGNQKTLTVQQEDGSLVAVTQPIRTSAGGVPMYSGSPVTLLVEGNYSLKVLDSNDVQEYYVPNVAYDLPFGAAIENLSNYDDLADAVATIGATQTELWLDTDDSSNATVPATMSVRPIIGNVMSGTVTWNGPVMGTPTFKWLGGTGHTFGAGSVPYIRPDWWIQNVTPKTTDMTTAIQAAVDSGIDENISPEIGSLMLVTASINVDRAVDGLAFDEYYEIYSHNGGGFYVNTAIEIFSSTIAFTTAPVSQLVLWNGIYFEADSSATAAYVLDDSRFLRSAFHNCSFSKIKCVNSPTVYNQSIRFEHCQMRRWSGTFFNSLGANYDVHFVDCKAEAGGAGSFIYLATPIGCSVSDGLMQGFSDSAIKYSEAEGFAIHSSYFEGNGSASGYDIEVVVTGNASYAVSILGNTFRNVEGGGYVPVNREAILWDVCYACESRGNIFTDRGHHLKSTGVNIESRVSINDFAVNGIVTLNGVLTGSGYANSAFLAIPTNSQDNVALGGVTVAFGTEIYDDGGDFAANVFTAPRTGRYRFDVSIDVAQLDSGATLYEVILATSSRNYVTSLDPQRFSGDLNAYTFTLSSDCLMTAGHTAYVLFSQTGGAPQTDISTASRFSMRYVGF